MKVCALSVLLFFSGCQKPSGPAARVDAPSFQSPTATEVFNLRSKCAELGEKIMKNTALRDELKRDELKKDQLSRYDPKTNRCYVQLTVWNANLAKGDDYFQRYLYDGQTGQVLAAMRREHGVRSGDIYIDPSPLSGNPDELYLDASLFISKTMADDRQQ
jgi:nitrate reductase alpha subunit